MNNEERKVFWDTLKDLDGQDYQQNFEKIKTTIHYPKELCKFKKVDDYSLLGLQTNQLYIPSAIQYDDPFDTYLHIDWLEIKEQYFHFFHFLQNAPLSVIQNLLTTFFNKPITEENIRSFYNFINQHKALEELVIMLNEFLRPQVQKNMFSISFTESFLNETLWLKYANSHKGFCLVYDLEEKLPTIQKNLFPIYYSSEPYDATTYAMYLVLKVIFNNKNDETSKALLSKFKMQTPYAVYKVSLIKKECHHYDQEWRYLSSDPNEQYLEWKPSKIILGLRTPKHHIELIKNSAKIAGIQNIYQVYINEKDELDIQKLEI